MKITFIGATHEVTGSCYYLEAAGRKFLVDYGMEQGPDYYENQDLPIAPGDLDFVLLTHAHMDHSGNLPALYAKGYQGPIYATEATCNLCDIMLRDSAHIQMFEAEWRNRKGRREGKPEFIPAYTMEDAMGVLRNFVRCPYDKTIKPAEGIEVRFVDAGHLLGSSSIEVNIQEDGVEKKDFIWKMGGQQGQGVESCGEILGRVLAQEGYSLFSQRLFASRIKGGHTTIALRIATKEIATIGEHVDCLVALDQETIDLHGKEICEGGVIIADDAFKPKWEAHTGRIFLPLPSTEMAKKYGSMKMKNNAALGMSAGLLGFPETPFYRFIAERFAKKGEAVINKNKEIFKEGYDTAVAAMQGVELGKLAVPEKKDQLYLLGNEAAALGAISAGSRFMASYPITPASEIMEYMIKVAHKIHGTVVQTEDELSSVMMAMGAGYGGVRAFTATSGPGLSLMAESISMAAVAEIPVIRFVKVYFTQLCAAVRHPIDEIDVTTEQGDSNVRTNLVQTFVEFLFKTSLFRNIFR